MRWVVLFWSFAFASNVGNPALSYLLQDGLFMPSWKWASLRLGVVYDNVYKARFEDKFKSLNSTPSHLRLRSFTAIGTINILKHLDLYGIAGDGILDVDNMIHTSGHLLWGGGAKGVLLHYDKIFLGFDVKYLREEPPVKYFILSKESSEDANLAPVKTPLSLLFQEIQGALTLSYCIEPFVPYIGATYLFNEIEPLPHDGLFCIPGTTDLWDFRINTSQTRRNYGLILGVSLLADNKLALNIEGRFFDQKGFSIMGEFRF